MQVTTIGLDIAKRVFQVHGIDSEGAIVIRRKLKRAELLHFFSRLVPCLVGIEACATAHQRFEFTLDDDFGTSGAAKISAGNSESPRFSSNRNQSPGLSELFVELGGKRRSRGALAGC
jgi:hypothetical protein